MNPQITVVRLDLPDGGYATVHVSAYGIEIIKRTSYDHQYFPIEAKVFLNTDTLESLMAEYRRLREDESK